jgi:hypothetical protein
MAKDWIGTKRLAYSTLGASNHSNFEREQNDYYATDPKTIDALFAVENFSYEIWEPACGEGHLSKRMIELGKKVYSTDLFYRGYGKGEIDFLGENFKATTMDIITNPPYKYAQEFCERALETILEGRKVAMFLKLTFLEGKKRRKFFEIAPPRAVYVFSERQTCALNGDFSQAKAQEARAICYAWFVWEKGFKGNPEIQWI